MEHLDQVEVQDQVRTNWCNGSSGSSGSAGSSGLTGANGSSGSSGLTVAMGHQDLVEVQDFTQDHQDQWKCRIQKCRFNRCRGMCRFSRYNFSNSTVVQSRCRNFRFNNICFIVAVIFIDVLDAGSINVTTYLDS
jgi:hypothetical protein